MGELLAIVVITIIALNIMIWGISVFFYFGDREAFTYLEIVKFACLAILIVAGIIGIIAVLTFLFQMLFDVLSAIQIVW